ncbi:hypothetical protein J6590_004929 [Homalodisca vitripennis]|nr:hypothetical protein J6590_004929 [Homalodisca vitripennis]
METQNSLGGGQSGGDRSSTSIVTTARDKFNMKNPDDDDILYRPFLTLTQGMAQPRLIETFRTECILYMFHILRTSCELRGETCLVAFFIDRL